MKRIAVCCLALLLASAAIAGDVQTLYRVCTAPKSNQVAEPYCIGKIEGISALLELNGAIAQHETTYRDKEVICPPKGATNGDRVRIFLDWHRAHPEEANMLDVVGVVAALKEARPCHFSN